MYPLKLHVRNGLDQGIILDVGSLLRKKMEHFGWDNGAFLIDGFPRNADNLDGWNKTMAVGVKLL